MNKIYYIFLFFFIKELNLIIEIKSSYYFNIDYNKNIAKIKACSNLNYIIIIDKNYDFLNNWIKNHHD